MLVRERACALLRFVLHRIAACLSGFISRPQRQDLRESKMAVLRPDITKIGEYLQCILEIRLRLWR